MDPNQRVDYVPEAEAAPVTPAAGPSPLFLPYYLAVVVGGLALLGGSVPRLLAVSWPLVLLWIGLILLVDSGSVRMPGGGFITVSSTLDYAGILIIGPAGTALAEFCATLVLQLAGQRRPFHKALFNASTFAGTVIAAGAMFSFLGGVPGAAPRFPELVIPILGMGVVYYALNSWIVSLVIALSERRNPWHIWQVNYIWTIFHMIASLPFAAAIAVGHASLGIWGVVLFILPIILARHSFKLYIDAKQDLIDFATVLTGVIDEVDPYTRKHSQRVSRHAARIAREMGMPERDVELVEYAGLLHDIGKIKQVNKDLLLKAGKLTPEERARMSDHAALGADILRHVRAFRRVAPLVRHHHERPDGRGYPDGLSGDLVPLGSRIVLVADAFDAMTSDRVYRRALTIERALAELRRCAGTQFDARVVEALERLVHKGEIVPHAAIGAPDPEPMSRPGLVNAGLTGN